MPPTNTMVEHFSIWFLNFSHATPTTFLICLISISINVKIIMFGLLSLLQRVFAALMMKWRTWVGKYSSKLLSCGIIKDLKYWTSEKKSRHIFNLLPKGFGHFTGGRRAWRICVTSVSTTAGLYYFLCGETYFGRWYLDGWMVGANGQGFRQEL